MRAGQVDPEVAERAPERVRAMPRMSATTTAMPTAADTKFCTVRPSIWVRWLIVDLARVPLPVGVGHEADRGVERDRAGSTLGDRSG